MDQYVEASFKVRNDEVDPLENRHTDIYINIQI